MRLTLDDGTTKIILSHRTDVTAEAEAGGEACGLLAAREAVTLVGQRVSVDTVQEPVGQVAKLNIAVGIKAAGPKRGFWWLLMHDELSSRGEAALMVGAVVLGVVIPLALWIANP